MTVKTTLAVTAAIVPALAASAAFAGPSSCDSRVNNTIAKLTECVTLDGARAHQQAWQDIADSVGGGIRTSGTPGYDASAQYVFDTLAAAGYNVTLQPFDYQAFIVLAPTELEQVAPTPGPIPVNIMSYSGSGDVTAAVSTVNLITGCDPADFAGFTPGHIALISRGACTFALKATNAEAAGASGVVIYNNIPGTLNGTLSSTFTLDIPVVSIDQTIGQDLALVADGPGLTLRLKTDTFRGTAQTANVIAETPGGNPDNVVMVGAHLDSVDEGPGIQDNGSGSAAILETAVQMAKVKPRNKVRFAWWGAEESGLVGSTYYVNNLTPEEQGKIALYLNFDMIGSPNHAFFIYDGDDSDATGAGPGPSGSAEIEKQFEAYYTARGLPFEGTDFSGRSDYGPFIAVGIPSGGLFTGAEGIKTPEQELKYGGTAGIAYDPCYHLVCDTFDNINLFAFDVNTDAVAAVTLTYAMSTAEINGVKGKGNFNRDDLYMLGSNAIK